MPRWVLALAALGALFVLVPLLAMVLRVDWPRFVPLVTSESSLQALGLSLRTSLVATALCIVVGVPMALALARSSFPGQRLVRALVLLPLVLPPVVGGIALLYTFGRRGLVGQLLSSWGIDIAFSTTAVVLAQTFVALPFLVLSLEGALRTVGHRYETAAATLGAGPTTTLRRVTIPLLLPALLSGAVLSFARALGEFGATLTFAGSLAGTTRTLPLEIYLQRETDPDAAVALSLVLVVVAVAVVVASQSLGQRRRGDRAGARSAAEPVAGSPARGASTDETIAAESSAAGTSAAGTSTAEASETASAAGTSGAAVSPQPRGLRIDARSDARDVEVSFEVRPGETVALLGPNGSGKSTALALVAGTLGADTGHAAVGDRALFDRDRHTALPAHRRRVTLLAQDALLFPHLTALDNVAFGPRSAGASRARSRAVARDWLDRVDAAPLASRLPGDLSGGQAQRVAIARALAAEPDVLLLDEPLSALDVPVASAIRRLLRTVLADRTTVIVTHDVLDALTLADRVLVLERGRIVEAGGPGDVVERPRTDFSARLAGLTLFRGERRGDVLHAAGGVMLPLPGASSAAGDATTTVWGAAIRPEAVTLDRADSAAPEPTRLDRTIVDVEPRGDTLRVRGADIAADVTPAAFVALGLDVGDRAAFILDPAAIVAYPIEG